jgi:tetratricopeptide (TPR) repeat protein
MLRAGTQINGGQWKMSDAGLHLHKIQAALADEDIEAASRLFAHLSDTQRKHPNAALLQAMLLRKQGRATEALAVLSPLAARFPDQPSVLMQQGNALKDLGFVEEASARYSDVLKLRPGDSDALYNWAACNRASNPQLAGAQYLAAARAQPRLWDAYRGALECAHALPAHPSADAVVAAEADTALISVICCSISPEKLRTLQSNLSQHLDCWELVHIDDARSLSEGYARGLRRAIGDLLIFCHDDIRVLAPDFSARLRSYLRQFDLVGVAGSTRATGPAALWSGPPESHAWICYRENDRRFVSLGSAIGPVVSGAEVLDGVFFAGHRALFERIGFDQETFDGFHLYDIDFTWRAHRSGASIAICQDLMLEHASRGSFDARWQMYADRFRQKFPEFVFAPPASGPNSVEIEVNSDTEVISIYAWIREWQGAVGNAVTTSVG